MFIYMQKIKFIFNFFKDIVKTLLSCHFGNFGNAWPSPSKIIVSTCRKLSCLSASKRTNCITPLFLKISQENRKLILVNLDVPGHTHLKWEHQFEDTFDVYLQTKNQLHPSRFSWDIVQISQTCEPKVGLSTCRKLSCLFANKKSTSSLVQICIILMIASKMISSMFICMSKINFIIHFFLEV